MRYPFLNVIRDSVINLCDNHTSLLVRGGKQEGSCQFTIAHFLANKLSNDNLFIDCEFRRHGQNSKEVYVSDIDGGNIVKKCVIPDIIFHDRLNTNIFVVEIKIGNPDSYKNNNDDRIKDDRVKVFFYLQAPLFYHYGFCISNIEKDSFKIHIIHKIRTASRRKGREAILCYAKRNNQWEEERKRGFFPLY